MAVTRAAILSVRDARALLHWPGVLKRPLRDLIPLGNDRLGRQGPRKPGRRVFRGNSIASHKPFSLYGVSSETNGPVELSKVLYIDITPVQLGEWQ